MLTIVRHALNLLDRNRKGRWILLTVLAVGVSGMEMLGAILVFVLLSLVVDPESEIEIPVLGDIRDLAGDVDNESLLMAVVVGLGIFFILRAAVNIGAKYIEARLAHNAGARLASRLVEGYFRFPYATHLRRNTSEFVRNGHQATNELVAGVFIPIIKVVAESLLTVGMVIVLTAIAPAATGLAVVFVGGAALLLQLVIQPKLKRIGQTAHETAASTLHTLQQSLYGVRDIKVLGRERFFADRYTYFRRTFARARYLRTTFGSLPSIIMELALLAFILVSFGLAISAGTESSEVLSVLGLFAYAGMRLQPSIQRIIGGLNDLKFASAPLEDLSADLAAIEEMERQSDEEEDDGTVLPFQHELRVEDLTYTYEGAQSPALTGIDLTIEPGEQIGVCGPTGGGKTTLVDLIIGLLEPTSGRILVDGVDIRHRSRAWHRNLGVVPQMVFLMDDTLRRNIALGIPDDGIDEQALEEAVELAQLRRFVGSLPEGLETNIGERGIRISGGQRQRIAIARALYRRPSILIFDEGTSALDNATEAEIMTAIEGLRGSHTIILIAHRLSTVRNSDRVLFVEHGEITGVGPYDTLIEDHPTFRAMATST